MELWIIVMPAVQLRACFASLRKPQSNYDALSIDACYSTSQEKGSHRCSVNRVSGHHVELMPQQQQNAASRNV